MSFVERIKVTDGTEVASVNASNQLEVAEANSAAIKTAVELVDDVVFTTGGSPSGSEKLLLVGGVNDSSFMFTPLKFNDDGWLRTTVEMGTVSFTGQETHDAVFNTNWIVTVGGYASSSAPTAVTAGDACRIWTTLNGAVNIADGGSSITVDNSVLTDLSGAIVPVNDVILPTKMVTVGGVFGSGETRQLQLSDDGYLLTDTLIANTATHDTIAPTTGWFPISAYASSTTPTAVVSGDHCRVWTTLNGAINIADGNGTISIDDGSGSITVDGTVTANLAAGTNNIGDVDVLTVPAPLSTTGGGTEAAALRVTLANDSTGTMAVYGDVAHDAIDSGGKNPVKIGGYATNFGTNPTTVGNGDRTHINANRQGMLWTIGGHPNLQSAEYITTAAQTDDTILPAISAGTRYIIMGITVIASAANSVNTSVRIGFGTASVPAQGASGADAVTKVVLSHPNIPPGSGFSKGYASSVVGVGGDDEELRITCSVPTGGSIVVQVDYFTISG